MEKHFMIDIETTGIDPRYEDLLQIGIVEMDFVNGFWKPGRTFETLQNTFRQPHNEFAKKHMAALYARCNKAESLRPYYVRNLMLTFIASCGAAFPEVYFAGWNASNFDLPFLQAHGYLIPSSYETGPDGKDKQVGDFHYRIYEMGGAVSLAQNVTGIQDRAALLRTAGDAYPELQLPEGKEHDAIYDCYRQIRILNGLIRLVRSHG